MRVIIFLSASIVMSLILSSLFGIWHVPLLITLPIAWVLAGANPVVALAITVPISIMIGVKSLSLIISMLLSMILFFAFSRFIHIPLGPISSFTQGFTLTILGIGWYMLMSLIAIILGYILLQHPVMWHVLRSFVSDGRHIATVGIWLFIWIGLLSF